MTNIAGFRQINDLVEREARFVHALLAEIRKTIIGQDRLVERTLVGLLADGHILLEGVPGLAKTLLVKTIGQTIQAGFSRIQFTPDLLPSDLIGTRIYNPRTGEFSVQKGPIFSNMILADEINRAPAKVQSALLEAMQEEQVTIGDQTFPLEAPFLVLATQNPIEQEGTYPLPEAQVDRFMMKLVVDYPEYDEEREMIGRFTIGASVDVQPVVDAEYVLNARDIVRRVHVDEKIQDYALDIVVATRDPGVAGLVFLGYPLHPPGRPDKPRAAHLPAIAVPMLFVQGSRDAFGRPDELRPVLADCADAELVVVEGGDHSFKVRGREAPPIEDVHAMMQDAIARWIDRTRPDAVS